MSQANQCDCQKQTGKPCEACWQVAFEKLRQEARAEDEQAGMLGVAIEPPSPDARETDDAGSSGKKKRRVGGFHTKDGSAKLNRRLMDDDQRPRHQGRFIPSGKATKLIRDNDPSYIEQHPSLRDWVCPNCGPLENRPEEQKKRAVFSGGRRVLLYPPMLADEDDKWHCSSENCDAVVYDRAELLRDAAAMQEANIEGDETAAEDQPEREPTPEEMGIAPIDESLMEPAEVPSPTDDASNPDPHSPTT